jgi:hypothetical protein
MTVEWTKAVESGRRGGRGFVVEAGHQRFVLTAGHCLPHLLPSHPDALEERIYPKLLGPVGEDPGIRADCLVVDPVADLAVLGSPGYKVDSHRCH